MYTMTILAYSRTAGVLTVSRNENLFKLLVKSFDGGKDEFFEVALLSSSLIRWSLKNSCPSRYFILSMALSSIILSATSCSKIVLSSMTANF